jgi:uncharacterized protein (DUF362 family)
MKNIIEKALSGFPAPGAPSSRRLFIRSMILALGSFTLAKNFIPNAWAESEKIITPRKKRRTAGLYDLAVVRGDSPGAIARKAVEALGGMGRFVRRGDTVVIKPNIGWDRAPEYAANTNPEVVASIVRLCLAAGARRVKVFDNTCNQAVMCYRTSGIADAVSDAGGHISYVNRRKFIPARFPPGSAMKEWPIYLDAVECDCFINVPVAKHHSLAGLTLSMKNLMGVCGGNRGMIHWNMEQKLAELTKFISPDLTVIDAYRILLRHGPTGGSLEDVKLTKTVIAGTDPVLTDSYASTLFGVHPRDIGYIRVAEEFRLGTTEISKARIKKIVI